MADTQRGPLHYQYDARGRLVAQVSPRGTLHRAMDAVGNVFRTPGLTDRRYGRGGRLDEAEGARYVLDEDGNQTEKVEADGSWWRYRWNGAGLLSEVQRPDGLQVRFEYDAFSRRTRKILVRCRENGSEVVEADTRFVWDGHTLVHEVSTGANVTTWYFEPDSFTPVTKESSGRKWAIVSDHQGTPTEMYDDLGQTAWRMQLDAFGVGRADVALQQCPWRWPGQYEDEETGLLYNRFRYYDAYAGRYISQDPLGLAAGSNLYGYPEDPLSASDPLGLNPMCNVDRKVSQKQYRHVQGRKEWIERGQGSYLKSMEDAQAVLDAAHNGTARVLGTTKQGHIVVEFPGVTGFNNNPGAGFLNQPTNVFMIKGTSSPSIVPTSPTWTPTP